MELAGVTDILTKAYGSTAPKNLVKATIDALRQLQNREQVEAARGVTLGKARRRTRHSVRKRATAMSMLHEITARAPRNKAASRKGRGDRSAARRPAKATAGAKGALRRPVLEARPRRRPDGVVPPAAESAASATTTSRGGSTS